VLHTAAGLGNPALQQQTLDQTKPCFRAWPKTLHPGPTTANEQIPGPPDMPWDPKPWGPPLRALWGPRRLRGPAVVGALYLQDARSLQRRQQSPAAAAAGNANDAAAIAAVAGSRSSVTAAGPVAIARRRAAFIWQWRELQVSADHEVYCIKGDLSILHKSWQRPCEGRWDAVCRCQEPCTLLKVQQRRPCTLPKVQQRRHWT
jgi:hypothetical protein